MRMFLILPLLFLLIRCDSVEPTIYQRDLEFDVLVYEDKSGIVVINASSATAAEFYFDMNEIDVEPVRQAKGDYEHTYKGTGTYNIEVRAYLPDGNYYKKEKSIFVDAGEIINVGQGYGTPLSYDGMKLAWQDEFNAKELNMDDWSYDNGTGCPNLCGWGNNELEYYRPENSWLEDGTFVIEAKEESFQGSNYTSTKIVSRNKKTFTYGRVDIRAKLPKGKGIWPALWMLGQNHAQVGWPKCGEIDIMEMVGGNNRENTSHGNAYWDNDGAIKNTPNSYILPDANARFYNEFHVFSIIWDEKEIRYFVDDNQFHSIDITTPDKDEFHKPFYFIMNVAIGGNWPGDPDEETEFPTKMYVDYIRVFQEE